MEGGGKGRKGKGDEKGRRRGHTMTLLPICTQPYQEQNTTLGGVSPFPGDPPKHFFGPPEYPLMIGCDQFHIIQDSCFAGEGLCMILTLSLKMHQQLIH